MTACFRECVTRLCPGEGTHSTTRAGHDHNSEYVAAGAINERIG